MRCCAGDEGSWPFGVALRRETSSRRSERPRRARQQFPRRGLTAGSQFHPRNSIARQPPPPPPANLGVDRRTRVQVTWRGRTMAGTNRDHQRECGPRVSAADPARKPTHYPDQPPSTMISQPHRGHRSLRRAEARRYGQVVHRLRRPPRGLAQRAVFSGIRGLPRAASTSTESERGGGHQPVSLPGSSRASLMRWLAGPAWPSMQFA